MREARRVRIECAIAKHWPDLARVATAAVAEPWEVYAVWQAISLTAEPQRPAVNKPPRPEQHRCTVHPAGSRTCHRFCFCACADCVAATRTLVVMEARARRRRAYDLAAQIPRQMRRSA